MSRRDEIQESLSVLESQFNQLDQEIRQLKYELHQVMNDELLQRYHLVAGCVLNATLEFMDMLQESGWNGDEMRTMASSKITLHSLYEKNGAVTAIISYDSYDGFRVNGIPIDVILKMKQE